MNTPSSWIANRRQVLDCGRGLPHSRTLMRTLLAAFLFATLGMVFAGCSKNDNASAPKTLYTCGMHPQVIQDHPGNCPICGMKLTPVRKQGEQAKAGNIRTIAVDPVTIQNMGVRTSEVIRGPLRRTIRTVANVDYDETTLLDVTTKFKGWIEKLHVNATGQLVNPGDPLFECIRRNFTARRSSICSRSIRTSTNDPGAAALRETAAAKLKFFDISAAQIAELEKTRPTEENAHDQFARRRFRDREDDRSKARWWTRA